MHLEFKAKKTRAKASPACPRMPFVLPSPKRGKDEGHTGSKRPRSPESRLEKQGPGRARPGGVWGKAPPEGDRDRKNLQHKTTRVWAGCCWGGLRGPQGP